MRIDAGQHVGLTANWVLETVQPGGNRRQLWLRRPKRLKPQDVCMRLSPFEHFATYYASRWRADNAVGALFLPHTADNNMDGNAFGSWKDLLG